MKKIFLCLLALITLGLTQTHAQTWTPTGAGSGAMTITPAPSSGNPLFNIGPQTGWLHMDADPTNIAPGMNFYFNRPIFVNTGIISSYNSLLSLQTSRYDAMAGTFFYDQRMVISNLTGYVGINNPNPASALDVGGTIRAQIVSAGTANGQLVTGSANGAGLNWGTSYLSFNSIRNPSATNSWTILGDGSHNGGGVIWGNAVGQIYFAPIINTGPSNQTLTDAAVASKAAMVITADGRVGIGPVDGTGHFPDVNFQLSVNGNLIAQEIQVATLSNWPDYVFNPEHKLMPISELGAYLSVNRHLPNIPSAAEVKEKGGFNVGEMQVKSLEKTEELYLYLIELDKRMQALANENSLLKDELEKVRQR